MPRIIADGQPAGAGGGLATGDISTRAPFSQDITAVAAPAAGTLAGTDIDTLDHDGAGVTEEGQRVDFKVPDDYDSGDLLLKITYAMSTSSGNNIRVSTKAEIIDVSAGTIDTGTYPKTFQTVTPPSTLDEPTRESFLAISSADFGGGDTIQFQVTRNPADGLDTHLGDWQVISYEISYLGQVATRESIQHIQIFNDTDEPAPPAGTKGDFDTLDYSASADQEKKFVCIIPENWDGFSEVFIRLTYAMDNSAGGVVVVETEGDIADVSAGSTTAIAVSKIAMPVPSDTDPHRTTVIRGIDPGDLGVGDTLVIKVARRSGTDSDDTATGVFQVINATVITGVGPKTGFDVVTVEEHYLYNYDFRDVSGSTTAAQESADFAFEFETWTRLTGILGAGSRANVEFQGRLMTAQSKVSQMKIPIMGNTGAQYQIKVYADSFGGTNQYGATSLLSAPTSRSLITLTDADLSNDPGGEGRYFIVVEATLDVGEWLRVGLPFVKQE